MMESFSLKGAMIITIKYNVHYFVPAVSGVIW